MAEDYFCERHGLVEGNDNPEKPCFACAWEAAGYEVWVEPPS